MGEFSKELCGGTHAQHTGDIGLFKILANRACHGVRRIEMVTGATALDWINEQGALLERMACALKTKVNQVEEKLGQFVLEFKNRKRN